MKYEVWNIFYMYSLLLSLNILFNLNCGNRKFEPCTVDDTSECEFARAVKRKRHQAFGFIFYRIPSSQLSQKWNQNMNSCCSTSIAMSTFWRTIQSENVWVYLSFFFFLALWLTLFLSVDADLTSWNGCWKPFFTIQLRVCTCGVYLCSMIFIYIFFSMDRPDQSAGKSCIFFAALKMGHLHLTNTD